MLSELVILLLMILAVGLGGACRAKIWYTPVPPDAWFLKRQQIRKLSDAWEIRMYLVGGSGLAMIEAVRKLSNHFDYPLIDIDETFAIHAMNNWVWLIPIMAVILFVASFFTLIRFGAPLVGRDLIRREKDLGIDIKIPWW